MRAREAFADSVRKYVASEEALAGIRARKTRLEATLLESARDNTHAPETAAFFQAYRLECSEEITAERATIAAKAEMEHCRGKYTAANREVKVIDRLEEKSRAAYQRESERAVQAELDDIAGYRFIRGRTTPAP
jgi:flagellar export protein FliJ